MSHTQASRCVNGSFLKAVCDHSFREILTVPLMLRTLWLYLLASRKRRRRHDGRWLCSSCHASRGVTQLAQMNVNFAFNPVETAAKLHG